MGDEAERHPAPLREALPVAPSRPDTQGGVAAAASLRRSRSPESPRLRRRLRLRLRLLLSLRLFPALSVSGLWCSAGGGGGGSSGGGARKPALRLRARGPARPRPLLRGWLRPTPRPSRGDLTPAAEGRVGPASRSGQQWLFSFTHTNLPYVHARDLCVCLRESGHIFCPALANSSELGDLASD